MKLSTIPLVETGPDFPIETLEADLSRAHALIDGATRGVPRRLLATLDALSRRWLVKSGSRTLAEIDRIAEMLDRPGTYFLSVNYEWGCTTMVRPAHDHTRAELLRVLDWRTPGLGRYIVAARVNGAGGVFVTLTWPGYRGVLQAMAPGRFAAALNQAPMAKAGGGVYPLDWFVNKVRVWRSTADTPAHVLRTVFETAMDFEAARRMLIDAPLAAPAIYSLVGTRANELCIIERSEREARAYDGTSAAANAWRTPGWRGRSRGEANAERSCALQAAPGQPFETFAWLQPPVLNPTTRLVMVADPASGRLACQGFEGTAPATERLDLSIG